MLLLIVALGRLFMALVKAFRLMISKWADFLRKVEKLAVA